MFSSVTRLATKVDKLEGQLIEMKTDVKVSEEFCEKECSKVKNNLQELGIGNNLRVTENKLEAAFEANLAVYSFVL